MPADARQVGARRDVPGWPTDSPQSDLAVAATTGHGRRSRRPPHGHVPRGHRRLREEARRRQIIRWDPCKAVVDGCLAGQHRRGSSRRPGPARRACGGRTARGGRCPAPAPPRSGRSGTRRRPRDRGTPAATCGGMAVLTAAIAMQHSAAVPGRASSPAATRSSNSRTCLRNTNSMPHGPAYLDLLLSAASKPFTGPHTRSQ